MRLSLFTLTLCFFVLNARTFALPVNKVPLDELNEQTKFGEIVELNKEPETTTKTPEPSSTTQNQTSRFVPLEQWHCGSNDWDKWFAHELIKEDCPARMADANDCCLTHDFCYVKQLPQEQCDQAFCQCLNDRLNPYGCSSVAKVYCDVVQTFGAEAHRNSKDYVAPKEEPTTTTSTAASTTSEISFFKVVDSTEKQLFQTSVSRTWDPTCYSNNKGDSTCKTNLESCLDSGFTCINNFCECAHKQLYSSSNKERVECHHNLQLLCGDYFANEKEHHRRHPNDPADWSWTEEKLGLSPMLAIFILICLLVSMSSAVFWFWRYIRHQRQPKCKLHGFANAANSSASSTSTSSTPSNSSSAASFLLTADEDSENGKLSSSTLNCMPS